MHERLFALLKGRESVMWDDGIIWKIWARGKDACRRKGDTASVSTYSKVIVSVGLYGG
jgi:hypothetical protein